MEVLELKPLKKKSLKLVLVESEFPIEWWIEGTVKEKHELIWNLHLISKEYLLLIEGLIDEYKPNFAIEEKGSQWKDTSSHDDLLENLFREKNIPYQLVNISENAEDYLVSNLEGLRTLIIQLTAKIDNIIKQKGNIPKDDFNFQKLVLWKEYLQHEYNERENEIRYKVREAWMMMKIINIARELEEKRLKALFICDGSHFDGICHLAEELGIETEKINVKKTSKIVKNPRLDSESIENIIGKSILKLTPIKVKNKEKEEKILYFFDTDDYASPFDINMAYDAGFDVVVPFCKMRSDKVKKLVQDAMFSRKVGAPTVYFVGGSNIEESEKIAEEVLNALVPPFESPMIIDPRGAHTTASALVAKTIEVARKHGITDLSGRKVVCFGGTGPVGQIGALIASKLYAKVVITSRREKAVKELAKELTKKAGKGASEIIGIAASTNEQRYEIVKDADIIWSVGKAGIQMLSKEQVSKLPPTKILVDINLVPPYGIEGLKPKFNNEEFYPGIYGIGALNIGRLKYKVESSIFKKATTSKGKTIFDYNYAFELATRILFSSEIKVSH